MTPDERRKIAAGSNAKREHLDRRLGEIERELRRIVGLMVKSDGDVRALGTGTG